MISDLQPQRTNYDVYVCRDVRQVTSCQSPPGFHIESWRPRATSPRNPWLPRRYALWTGALWTGIFRNRDFWVYAWLAGGDIAHYSCVVPAWFRWPFMDDNDIQVSNTWTSPEHRGRGLARSCLTRIAQDLGPGRSIWYVTRPENLASVRVCESAGFSRLGQAERVTRLGSRSLGTLQLDLRQL